MFNQFFKSKRTPLVLKPSFTEGARPEPIISEQQWLNEFNVSNMHTVHTPIEDSNLVPNMVYDTATQLKNLCIKQSQQRFLNSL